MAWLRPYPAVSNEWAREKAWNLKFPYTHTHATHATYVCGCQNTGGCQHWGVYVVPVWGWVGFELGLGMETIKAVPRIKFFFWNFFWNFQDHSVVCAERGKSPPPGFWHEVNDSFLYRASVFTFGIKFYDNLSIGLRSDHCPSFFLLWDDIIAVFSDSERSVVAERNDKTHTPLWDWRE